MNYIECCGQRVYLFCAGNYCPVCGSKYDAAGNLIIASSYKQPERRAHAINQTDPGVRTNHTNSELRVNHVNAATKNHKAH